MAQKKAMEAPSFHHLRDCMPNKSTKTADDKIIKQQIEVFTTKPYRIESNQLKGWRVKDFGRIKAHLAIIETEMKQWLDSRQESSRKARKTALNLIIPNLVASSLSREPLSIAGMAEAYKKDSYLDKFHLKREATKEVINGLIETGYMQQYAKGSNLTGRTNQYIAGKKLNTLLAEFLYAVERDFSEALETPIKVNRPKTTEKDAKGKNRKVVDTSQPIIQFFVSNNIHISTKRTGSDTQISQVDNQTLHSMELDPDHPDVARLRKINLFLQDCSYALKGPVQIVYSNNRFTEGGRLYCDLQNLPNRRAKIRLNTLFNGNPVAEVDLKCNHPAMLMALNGEQIRKDFYSDLAKKTGLGRNTIKGLMTRFIGAKDERISLSKTDWIKDGYELHEIPSQAEKEELIHILEQDYPTILKGCFCGIGVALQSLEGQIMLDAMCELIESNNMPSLPIHDCLFIEAHRVLEAKNALKKSWKKHLRVGFTPHLEVKTVPV